MASSRALKDIMLKQNGIVGKSEHKGSGMEPKRQHHAAGDMVFTDDSANYARGGAVKSDHWMQRASEHSEKGALHRHMGIPQGEKISTGKLERATHAKSPIERKEANLALRYRGK